MVNKDALSLKDENRPNGCVTLSYVTKSYINLFIIFDKRLSTNFSFIFLSYLEGKNFLRNNSSFLTIFPSIFFPFDFPQIK